MALATLGYPAIHPFPARMAPELISGVLTGLPKGVTLLDPMMGSGSFPLAAGRSGHNAIGLDSDPLALIIARTGLCRWDPDRVRRAARVIVKTAMTTNDSWTHPDPESDAFIDYWFDGDTKNRLGALADAIRAQTPDVRDPLWVGFSRLIITKDSGASRARDVSHSRPHRVREGSSFDPAEKYVGSIDLVVKRALMFGPPAFDSKVGMIRGDVRALPLNSGSVDAVMTSPPYLTAIDYLRGHRMSLVWMGYTISELRGLRSKNIGSERGARPVEDLADIAQAVGVRQFSRRAQGILNRYIVDLDRMMSEIERVLRPGGTATFVVADATSNGKTVDIAAVTRLTGVRQGLSHSGDELRELPISRRYLPTPSIASGNSLAKRMRVETIISLSKKG